MTEFIDAKIERIEFTTEKRENFFGGWTRNCRVSGVDYCCSVKRGKSVRIPFKPRGKNRGWHYHGSVYSNGKCLWNGRVSGSIGVRGLLLEAGVFDVHQPAKGLRND